MKLAACALYTADKRIWKALVLAGLARTMKVLDGRRNWLLAARKVKTRGMPRPKQSGISADLRHYYQRLQVCQKNIYGVM